MYSIPSGPASMFRIVPVSKRIASHCPSSTISSSTLTRPEPRTAHRLVEAVGAGPLVRRQPEEPYARRPRPLDRGLEERAAEALAVPVAAHRQALHLGALPAVLGLSPNNLHRADDDAVLARRKEHAPHHHQ